MRFKLISLRARIFLIVACLVLINLAGGSLTIWLMYRIGVTLGSVIDVNVTALNVAQELETALVMQKGLLTYYFFDGDAAWLDQLGNSREAFEKWLKKARETSFTDRQRDILNEIESKYIRYSHSRDQVIVLYMKGEREAGFKLHREIRSQFFAIRDLCEQYKQEHSERIAQARTQIRSQVWLLNVMALVAMPSVLLLGAMLVYVLIKQVLGPVRQLAVGGVDPERRGIPMVDEVKALSRRVHSLMEDVDHTQSELQLSREHLLQSEKLAMVGKLAAGVAHTIRNPLTSVKMRLFSMERTLDLTPTQKDDFEVISEEIRHIDTIVRNFLEFSRPPKLKIQKVSPSDVVDMALQLMRHRLESYGVGVELYRQRALSRIEADPELLKEVLVNLIVNACEAMGDGGVIKIREEEGFTDPLGHVVVIRLSDNGPGIPESIREKVFQPFFSTKEEGTGLGLSIAARIIEDHKGCLNVKSREGKGTTFTITLPCKEDGVWLRS
jgi:signal transduction histidine kinase